MKEETATETNAEAIAPQETVTATTENDAEAKIAALEAEKAKIVEERDNYKKAYLKLDKKSSEDTGESEEDKLRRIIREEQANSRISEIDKEKETLFQKTLRENKELKAAHLAKKDVVQSGTSSTEGTKVQDTTITADQMKHFKENLKWSDKDIERYKKSIQSKR